jgi:hypothetical protein
MGKQCDRQRNNGVSLVTVIVGLVLTVGGLLASLVCRFHVPPYPGPEFIAGGFGAAGLILFLLGLWRLAIRPAPVDPEKLIVAWEAAG